MGHSAPQYFLQCLYTALLVLASPSTINSHSRCEGIGSLYINCLGFCDQGRPFCSGTRATLSPFPPSDPTGLVAPHLRSGQVPLGTSACLLPATNISKHSTRVWLLSSLKRKMASRFYVTILSWWHPGATSLRTGLPTSIGPGQTFD